MLDLYGGEDPRATGTVPDLVRAMQAAGKSFEYHSYPGTRHAFFPDTRPMQDPETARDAGQPVLACPQGTLRP
ncbi:protein of unknown function [Candidatus Hydrogenisulfobacillus filiaventi]|uniref:Dienelactone hydrolase domain-containing protein n=1 Tax=Candidatus Hydrogenisulfobacillus filiaventi TaxID=2707344 RepID=A0A6F8ZEI3_9FIRM|nr:dienelactone hydrolase family protein [Bacillota bacterium]CAB1128053.1 protein of unknown function [Candidatus Hydrogenisulfobacillus filiaventi]